MEKKVFALSLAAFTTSMILLSAGSKVSGKGQPEDSRNQATIDCQCNPTRFEFGIRGAAFIPIKNQLRQIYGAGLATLQFEGSYSIFKNSWRFCDRLLLWENVSWTTKVGRTPGFGYYSKLNLVPISVGLEYQVSLLRCLDFYFGAGPSYSFLRIKNKDGFNTSRIKRGQFGFVTKTGFRYTFCTYYFLDVFADYYYTHFRNANNDPIQKINTQFSAFFVGGAFGFRF